MGSRKEMTLGANLLSVLAMIQGTRAFGSTWSSPSSPPPTSPVAPPSPATPPAALDIVFANTATPLRGSEVLRNDGTGKFSPVNLAGRYSTDDAHAVAAGDIDGDGHDELFIGYWAAGPVKMH